MGINYYHLAQRAIDGHVPDTAECLELLNCPDEDMFLLLDQVYRMRQQYFGKHVHIQVLKNAKSGNCQEDCRYCSQSSVSSAEIEHYPLISPEILLEDALQAARIGADRFCISTGGRSAGIMEVDRLCEAIIRIKKETDLPLCATLGLITASQAGQLKAAGLDRINHNLNTSRRYYPQICTTHSFQDRMDTIIRCKNAGLEICSGGIVGQGETPEDIVDLLFALREIQPQSIPLNFLVPISGTPFENFDTGLTPYKCLKILSLARLINPRCELRTAGGWEYHFRELKPLAFLAADSIFVNGYLTTPGSSINRVSQMITDMGMECTLSN
jgi:biotin synthase